jgi:hypothetical protein
MPTTDLHTGQTLHGFRITDIIPLAELNATLIRLRHEKTGARMVHLATEDPNNLFAVGFRTPPDDSTGVAHILEHTVLCGSKNFPVRDPFFTMLKRSLNTFMNAMTASDWTLYPFSSQNTRDFYNLLDIYLDAAFFPLLRERDFRQEGHRLEFARPEDPQSPLEFKGVVYNEMKGAMASPPSLLGRRLAKALYPSTTYGHNSGGEPAQIPDLTWEDLRAFHESYYHPSNAWFYTCGNLPLEKHLAVIEARVLSQFERREVESEVPPEIRFDAPRQGTETFPLAPGEETARRSLVQVGWLTCDISDSFERLALTILSSLLVGNPAAPLYKALLDLGLGENLAPGTGYNDDNRTTYFAAGLQGTDPEQAPAIEALILSTLEEAARSGFSPERIEGVIHRLEFGHREVSGDMYPYPLVLLMRIMGPWLHNDDPVSPLQLGDNLKRLRHEMAAGPFFQDLIRRHLLGNRHRVTLTLRPDPTQKEREDAATAKRLAKLAGRLDAEQRQQLIDQARELAAAQEAEEDISCLPTLTREDIPAEEEPVSSTLSREGVHEVQWFPQPTNGIDYFIAHLPTAGLPEKLLPYVPLFCTMLTQIGAAGYSYLEMAERMEAHTGGIQAGAGILDEPGTLASFQGVVELKGKALQRNQAQLFAILADLCRAPDFSDVKRLQTVIGQIKTSMENSIPASGHSYAARAAASHLTAAAALRETWSGLSQFRLIKELSALPPEGLTAVAERLQAIAACLFQGPNFSCGISGEEESFAEVRGGLGAFLGALPPGSGESRQQAVPPFSPTPVRLGYMTSIPVAYVTRVFRTVPYTHDDSAPLMVLAKLLRAGFLHREIREKGGAYGGLAGYDPEGGLFSLLSYRDPQLARTLRVFDQAVDWAAAGGFTDNEIDEAILSVFADLDRPLSPGGRGNREFANTRQGLTLEMRRHLRRGVLATDRSRLMAAAKTYLGTGRSESAVSVIAGEEMLTQANGELGSEGLIIERI